jgi:hypothetical protein
LGSGLLYSEKGKKMNNGNEQNRRIIRLCIGIVSIFGIICSIAVLFPFVQRLIISFAEEYIIHRKVNFIDDWMNTLIAWAKGCIALIVIFDFFTVIPPGRLLFGKISGDIKFCLRKINFRYFIKPVLLMTGIYTLGILTIIRANFSYIDDLDRAVEGYHGWNGWSRHLADILSTFIHADTNLTDISPLPQFLAVLLIAFSSVFLVYILCDKKITVLTLLAAVPVGLSPYFLENMSYKFDAPYMGLSIFFSIIPFLFIKSKRAFIFTSVVSLLIMCMTYQASSGIYVMLAIVLAFQDWNSKNKTNKEILGFLGISALSFCFSMLFFRLIFMVPTSGHGVSTSMLSLGKMVSGVLSNFGNYIRQIEDDFGLVWKIGIGLIALLFIIRAGKTTAQKGVAAIPAAIFVLLVALIMSYGVYILLENPLYAPRALYGFGIFIAIIGIYVISSFSKIAVISVLALNWCFFVFAFSYGNALADQKRYTDFRIEMVLQDLNGLFPVWNTKDMSIQVNNDIGFGPITENIAKHYPIIKRLVPISRHYHLYHYLTDYFHWGEGQDGKTNEDEPEVVLDTYYHTIKSNGEKIIVEFKH